jgi:hypothetical protein
MAAIHLIFVHWHMTAVSLGLAHNYSATQWFQPSLWFSPSGLHGLSLLRPLTNGRVPVIPVPFSMTGLYTTHEGKQNTIHLASREVSPGCGKTELKSGMFREIRDGWQPWN